MKISRQKVGCRRQLALNRAPRTSTGWELPVAAVPPDVRWWLCPTESSHPNYYGATPLALGAAPGSISSRRQATALPHIGRQSRKLRCHTVSETVLLMGSPAAPLHALNSQASGDQQARTRVLARRQLRRIGFIVVLMAVALCVLGCGKRRPPLPPIERVQQRTEALSGVQRGNQILLSWPAPQRNAPDGSVQSIRRVDVYRLAEKPRAPLALTEEDFATRSTLIGSVDYDQIKNASDVLTYTDTLELAGELARLRYALRYVNASGQRAAFSNFLVIEPAARIAQAPTLINTDKEVSEDAITISWKPPAANIDGSTPVNLLGYNLYRMEEAQNEISETPLNSSPVAGTEYSDKNFKFGETYRYIMRAVSLGTEGAQVESLNSNSISITPRDIFEPSTPTGISAVGAPGRISLFYVANPEPDIAGYNIFRSTDSNLPKDQWNKLNSELHTKTNFLDEKVESGKQYYYYLTAVDKAGNISSPSEVVSETVP